MAACVCVLLLFGACAPAEIKNESFALDTICFQQVRGGNASAAAKEVSVMLERITQEYSMYTGTQLKAINDSAPGTAAVSAEASALIRQALDTAAETGGSFDPTIGAVSILWDMSGSRIPSDEDIQAALPLVDYQLVVADGNTVMLPKPGMRIDLGGIAKGYAADLAVKIYEKHGVEGALLNLGGNIYAFGARKDGQSWRIGLRDPLGGAGEYAAVVEAKDISVVTSGSYERFFEYGGKVYHHLFDPRTGYPAQSGLLAVTVICKSSMRADALSTAFFVMGLEKGLACAQKMPDVEAVFFAGTELYVTQGLKESIVIANEAYTLKS